MNFFNKLGKWFVNFFYNFPFSRPKFKVTEQVKEEARLNMLLLNQLLPITIKTNADEQKFINFLSFFNDVDRTAFYRFLKTADPDEKLKLSERIVTLLQEYVLFKEKVMKSFLEMLNVNREKLSENTKVELAKYFDEDTATTHTAISAYKTFINMLINF